MLRYKLTDRKQDSALKLREVRDHEARINLRTFKKYGDLSRWQRVPKKGIPVPVIEATIMACSTRESAINAFSALTRPAKKLDVVRENQFVELNYMVKS